MIKINDKKTIGSKKGHGTISSRMERAGRIFNRLNNKYIVIWPNEKPFSAPAFSRAYCHVPFTPLGSVCPEVMPMVHSG
ncbi:hypothetical protein [Reichenbachiella sp.]